MTSTAKTSHRFRYTLRLRSFPETTFQALALGKIPEWLLGWAWGVPGAKDQALPLAARGGGGAGRPGGGG